MSHEFNSDKRITLGSYPSHKGGACFGVTPQDLRHHLYLIGKTGSGKTTLLRNLLVQHINMGHGVALIDPHGDLAEEILALIPKHRTGDVVYFDPADFDFPIGINPLANVEPNERSLAVSGIVSAFKNLWPDSWGPRMEYILQNAIAALLHCQNVSLLGVNRMLTDSRYRQWVVEQVDDPFVRNFWQEEFAGYDARFRREAIAPIQNKLGQFFLSPAVRNILGQVRTKISFPFIMDNHRIFIANLAKGKIGADKANLLGSLLVTQFQLAAMRRAYQSESERVDFFLHIDEFQNFGTEAFTSILSEARKYRLSLTLAHQYINQLSPTVRDAVFGNVGSLIAFQVGFDDAHVLGEVFAREFEAKQFVDLNRFETIASVRMDGHQSVPFRAHSLPPIGDETATVAKILQLCRQRFASDRNEVEDKLNRWLES